MNKKFLLRKFYQDLYMMSMKSDKGIKDERGTRYHLICPNCFGSVNGNPFTTKKKDEKTNQHHASFMTIPFNGQEYKVLCCADSNKCKKAWMKDRNCDSEGRSLGKRN